MALFKINKGLNANLPVPRHDGYAYFTTDDGKFWIDFEDNTDGVLQDDGTKVSRKALNAERADYVGYALTLQFDGDNQPAYNGLVARTYNISPENIHALSTINGGTVAGPIILNNVLTVNNDAYIDSATIGDLLINGGTRFVGDVNADKITASQFVGPLQGNATSADKVNHWLKIQVNGTDKVQYDGSGSNKTINLTADMLGLLGDTTPYALGDAVGGNAVAANKLNTNAGSTTRPVYFDAGIPKVISNSAEIDLIAKSANAVKENFIFQVKGTEQWRYNGSTSRTMNLTPALIDAFDIVEGSTVSGEAIFNNVVYLNDETYADSLTAENEIVTGTLRVVGDLNGSVINATTFNGALNGNATSADKVNHWLKIQLNGTDAAQYDGSGSNKTVNITPAAIGALDTSVLYALGDAVGGNAVAANKLTVNAGASDTPVYFTGGVPTAVTGTQNINVASADKVNHWLKIQLNGTDAAQYDGSSSNKTVNVTAASVGALDSGTLYAGSATQGGSASSAVKLDNDKDAGSNILPVYFSSGVPVAVSTSNEINILARQANKTTYWLKIQADGTDQVTFDGSTSNKTINITPELINAVRRNGDTIPGPLTINGVFTVNNDVYMDSATVGDLLVNGGTRFVGDVNAGKITASQFVGPLQGNATSADKVNNWLKIQVNGTDKVQYDGSGGNKTINLTAEMLGLLGNTTPYALGDAVGGNAVKANALNVSAAIGSTTRPVYIQASGVPAVISNTDEIDLVAKSANAVKENFIFQIKGTEQWRYNGSTTRTMNLSPALIDAFDIVEGSTVSGEAIFNNVVYLNDETYADSLTAENEIVTGTLRVVGDLNGSVINATTFNGALNGNATSADKVNHWLKIQFNGTDQATYDGSSSNKTVNITAANIGALGSGTLYAGSATQGGSASSAVKLDNDKDAGSSILPIYFSSGVPVAVSTSDEINILAKQANKTTHWLKIQFNSTDQVTFDGSSSNKTLNITPSAIGALSTSTNYAGSTSVGGAANSANKLNTDAGDATHPVYFDNGVPVQVSGTQNINVDSADKVNHWLKIQTDSTDAVIYDGSSSNKTVNITPEAINAVRRNGDTIPGPLTINGVFTVNNDAYIDSATVGDLLVNGGTRFVGDVNAGKITSSQFVGPLQGNATSADKVNYWLKIQVNGTDKVQYDGSGQNKTLNLTPELLGVLGGTTKYALGDAVGGNAVAANKLNTNAGSTTRPVYFDAGIPKVISNTDEVDLVAKKANSLKENFIYQLRGTEQWRFNGSTARTLNIVPNDMGIFDTIEGSTVSGEAVFNNVVYLNDETYADSLTAENEIVTGTLRVVGDLNGSVINATTFNGNATSADKVNHWLKIQFNGTDKVQYDGSGENKTLNITPSAIGALSTSTNYAGSSSVGGAATSANKLNTNAGSNILPVYFTGGVPSAVSTTDEINIIAKQANKTAYWLKIQADSTDQVTFDGSTQNKTLNITPELINAVRRNGDTIPGPLTINGVFTVNNDAYIDSATIGDLLVNGGTRFVGDVNAGKITASSFVGPLTGNATSADKVNHWLKIQFNGTDKVTYDGSSENKTLNITPAAIGAVKIGGDTMTGSLTIGGSGNIGLRRTGRGVSWNKGRDGALVTQTSLSGYSPIWSVKTKNGSWDVGAYDAESYYDDLIFSYVPDSVYNGSNTTPTQIKFLENGHIVGALDGNATSASKVSKTLKYQLRGSDQWEYDGSQVKTLNISPNDMGIFDTLLGSTVSGEAVFNNVVYLNDETYADSLTAENEIVTGTLRVVGDLNGSVVNATTFNGNATSADKVNHWLKIQVNGTDKVQYDGSGENKTLNLTPALLGLLGGDTTYALGDAVAGNAVAANKLTVNAGSSTLPVYFTGGVPSAVSTTDTINIVAKQANKTTYWLKIQADSTDKVTFDGSSENKTLNITPELINAVRRNGDTIPGPLTLNGVFTVNNDAYIDSATIGDLLVNGGTRFVGDVNAGKITASSFVGPLTGNATSADKVNHWLKIQFNGTDKVQYDGSSKNKTLNITPAAIGAVKIGGDTMTGDLEVPHLKITGTDQISHIVFSRQTDNYIKLPLSTTKLYIGTGAAIGNAWYGFASDGIHPARAVSDSNVKTLGTASLPWTAVYAGTFNGTATNAAKVTNKFKFQLRSTDQWEYDGSQAKTLNLSPNDMGIFDTLLGSTVSGEAVFNNVVYLNDETYADSLTAENEIVTGTLRVVGDLNGSVINATTFNGNATSADKVNNWLKIQFNGTDKVTYDGSSENKTLNITPAAIAAIPLAGTVSGSPITGSLEFGNADIGISRVGRSVSYRKGRDGALIKTTSISGYGALASIKTTNGSWDIGAYNSSGTTDDLLFNYVPDTTYNSSSNNGYKQIKFLENGHIVAALDGNATSASKVNYWLKIQADGTDKVTFDGSSENKTIDITPELINAVRRNGDTIPGPLTLNGVMTINNDAYIDSATIGDLLINGGTRFVGDVNAGNITASQFTGPLAGNATSADKVNKWLKIQFNGTDQAQFDGSGDNKTVNVTPNAIAAAPQVNGVYYGTCATAKGTKAKEVILVNGTGFQLVAGAMLVVKFTNASAAATMTLKVGTDAASAAAATGHTLYQYGTTKMADGTGTSGWPAGAIVLFIYDGTSWFRQFWYNNTYTLPTVTNIDCGTAAATAAKAITNGTWYTETAGNLFEVTMRYANTYAGPLTFNSKPLYINGTASSASNCTLPAGKYIVFYDGTNYYFRTDGLVPHVNGIYKQRYGNSNTKGVANGRLYFLLSDYVAPSTAYSSDMYNKTIYYKAFYKIRGVSSNPSYNQNSMSGEFNTVIGVKINNSGASNLQQAVGYWSQVPTTFGSTSTIYISSDTNVVASRKHAQFYVTSSGTNDFEYEVELMSVEKLIIDDANSTVGTPEELYTTSYINGTYESCVFMNMTNTRTNCALLNSNYAGSISNSVYASLAFDASRLINYFTADNGTTNYYLTGRGSTTSGAYSYLYSNTKTYIKGSGLYSEGSLHMNDIYGTSGHTYGTTLPSSPTTGQLFFQIDGASGSGSSGGSLSLAQKNSGTMYVLGYDGSDNTKAYYNTNVYVDCSNGILRGAAWNDYAEYRRDNHMEKRLQKPGNCVKENGDGTLSLTTKRLERGCEIISDTFGMAIGQNAREGYDTPIAVSGRVLAYPYESIEEFKAHIGYPVCSGPNGTVSIMTDEEEEKYASRIIGTISEIPTYDKWGESQVDVDGRVWIRIK